MSNKLFEDVSREFVKDSLDIDQRQKNIDKLEQQVEQIKQLEELYKSLTRSQRRKLFKKKTFSENLTEIFKTKALEKIREK